MVLFERDRPLTLLAEFAAQARRGAGRLVLVSGEAGVGKSTLLEQFANGLAEARWFWGACDGLFTPCPLGPFLEIASELGGNLADLFKSQASRDELFTALARELGGPGGLRVVVIEDIHWADEATLDLLRFLGRRIRQIPVLILATYREEELAASYPLRVALGELAVQRCTRRMNLSPLSAEAVATMAAGSGLDAAELHRVTGGNPFYVVEVLHTGLDRVPQAAKDAVLARAVRLGPQARNVLHTAALIGGVIEPSLLEQAAAVSPAKVDELVENGLLVADGAALRFRHEIARRAAQLAIPEHRQPTIHARILAALREHGCDDHARLAFHAEAAGAGAAALRHATLAGRRASELGAHREAAAQFERALRFAQGEHPEALAGRYDALAGELQMIDGFAAAADAYQRALGLWRQVGDRIREGDTLRKLSIALWRLCRGREAAAASAAALQVLEPLGPSAELARAYARVAADRAGELRWDEMSTLARQADELAGPLGLRDVQSYALLLQASVAWARGGDDWETLYQKALTIALEHGRTLEAGLAYTNLHEAYSYTGRYTESEPYYLAGVAYCEEHDLGTYLCCLQGVRAVTLERLGRWDESVALSGVVLRRVLASPLNRMIPVGSIGRIRARRGEPGAWEYLDQAMASADGTGDPRYTVPARLSRAEAHWLEGNMAAANHEAGLAEQAAEGAGPWLLGEAAAWARRTGAPRRPRGELAEPYRLQFDGDWQNAAKLWDEIGCPYDAALALLEATDESALRQALDICQGLGAAATARVVRRTMRHLGIRSIPVGQRSATREHPLGLTRRESEVLVLVCAGRTNAEIAGKLFISTKTAGHHVSAVLAKLGAPTREAAASEAARLGLADRVGLWEPLPVRAERAEI